MRVLIEDQRSVIKAQKIGDAILKESKCEVKKNERLTGIYPRKKISSWDILHVKIRVF